MNESWTFISQSVEETLALGRRVGVAALGGTVIGIDGPLGAGKTHFVRGVAEGAQVANAGLVSSPTYVLLNIYPKREGDNQSKTVFHLDAYRLTGAQDMEGLGFAELLEQEGIVVVEWASRVADVLPADRLAITIDLGNEAGNETERRFAFCAMGPGAAELLEAVSKRLEYNGTAGA